MPSVVAPRKWRMGPRRVATNTPALQSAQHEGGVFHDELYALHLKDVAKTEAGDVVDALEILSIRCDHSGADLTGEDRDTDISVM